MGRPSLAYHAAMPSMLLLFCFWLLGQAGWLWAVRHTVEEARRYETQAALNHTATLTARSIGSWLAAEEPWVGKLVLEYPFNGGAPQVLQQSGITPPPQFWSRPAGEATVFSPSVRLDGTEYLLRFRPLSDDRLEIQTRPMVALRALLAAGEDMHVHGAVLLHTQQGISLLHNTQPTAALREALQGAPPPETGVAVSPVDMRPSSSGGPIGLAGLVAFSATGDLPSSTPLREVLPVAFWVWQSVWTALTIGAALWIWRTRAYMPPARIVPTGAAQPPPEELQRQLRAAEARHRQLSGQLITLLESIRQRLARELHDHTGQRLAALLLKLEPANGENNANPIIENTVQELRGIQEDIRRLAQGLRPPTLDMLGLEAALRSLCDAYARAGLQVRCFTDQVPPLDSERALALYRVAQEAMTNAVKYAQARTVHVALTGRGNTLVLTIEDDGQGFTQDTAENAQSRGLGLTLMRERMAQWGGQLTVDSRPNHGTSILAELPL